jgi:cation diffusion facilitator CzcD-associated flavoprotein CzcO
VHHRDGFPIAIIGAGFAGIGAAVQLIKAGIHSFTIFERAREVGGTWTLTTDGGDTFAAEYVLRTRKLHPRDYEITRF